MVPRTSESSRANNLNIRLLFVLDPAHTLQREVPKFELLFETSGDSTVMAISPPEQLPGRQARYRIPDCLNALADR